MMHMQAIFKQGTSEQIVGALCEPLISLEMGSLVGLAGINDIQNERAIGTEKAYMTKYLYKLTMVMSKMTQLVLMDNTGALVILPQALLQTGPLTLRVVD